MRARLIRKRVREALAPPVLQLLRRLVERMSWAQVQRLGVLLGRIGRYGARHRVRLTLDNLKLAFGDELSGKERHALALTAFESTGRLGLEMLKLPTMPPKQLAQIAPFEGLHFLQQAREAGRGGLVVSAHLGNWEIGAVRIIQEGFRFVALSRASSSTRIARAVTAVRKELDFETIAVDRGIRPCLRLLRDNGILAIMPDRRARGQGVYVNFFGHPVNVWHTPILLALRTGAPVMPTHGLRQPDGSFVVLVEEPVGLESTGDLRLDLQVNTQRLFVRLEERIRQHPEQYLWQYDTWREAQFGHDPAAVEPPAPQGCEQA
jgi:KDO2-lipid IV(A) lauroyltransferase